MSIQSIANLARERRSPFYGTDLNSRGVMAASGGKGSVQPSEDGSSLLARAVPHDVIAFYTAIIGLLEGIEKGTMGTYIPLRSAIYGITLAATLLAITIASHFACAPLAQAPRPPIGAPLTTLAHASVGTASPQGDEGGLRKWLATHAGGLARLWRAWKPPGAETSTALFAFAVWGLITPGSPLYGMLNSPVLPITVGILTAGGGLAMNVVFVPFLSRKAT